LLVVRTRKADIAVIPKIDMASEKSIQLFFILEYIMKAKKAIDTGKILTEILKYRMVVQINKNDVAVIMCILRLDFKIVFMKFKISLL
jgi:hypothetical protein